MNQDLRTNKWVIYGSYGYTGRLIAELAAGVNKNIVLSGRNEEKLKKQAEELGVNYLPAELDDPLRLENLLNDANFVIHCAGPFIDTWKPMLDACIRNRCHYLDITGEIEVFEEIQSRSGEIAEARIMAMPGTGFDVVPTDCLALFLKNHLPDAGQLELAFMSPGGGISHGTAQTIAKNLGKEGAIRADGEIKSVPAAYKTRAINFNGKNQTVASIPWGDVSTAFHSTGIENIVVYTAMKPRAIRLLKLSNWIAPLLRLSLVRYLVSKQVTRKITGPGQQVRENGKCIIWGEVQNSSGKKITARLVTPEGYRLTALTSILIAKKVDSGNFKSGFQTPSAVYGEDLILEIDGTSRKIIFSGVDA